jgi:hypothetical protein
MGAGGTKSAAGVLGQCAALAHLDLKANEIGDAGAESLARVLAQCTVLAHLDLSYNEIGSPGAERLARALGQCASLAHFNLMGNDIGAVGESSSFVAWSSLWPCFVGTLHCLLFAICLADRQQERATHCTHTSW